MRKPGGKMPLGRPRCRWEDKIALVGQEIGWVTGSGFLWVRRGTGGVLL
jgi:hypothetical protein